MLTNKNSKLTTFICVKIYTISQMKFKKFREGEQGSVSLTLQTSVELLFTELK